MAPRVREDIPQKAPDQCHDASPGQTQQTDIVDPVKAEQAIQSDDANAEDLCPIKVNRCFGVLIFVVMSTNFDSGAVPAILDTMRR